jgi:hypothetical protein
MAKPPIYFFFGVALGVLGALGTTIGTTNGADFFGILYYTHRK